MARLSPQEYLKRIGEWLSSIYGPRLVSLIVYGSLAHHQNHSKFSDINLLAVLDRIDRETLDAAAPAMKWWAQSGHPPIVLLTRDEVLDAADVFPIEYTDIQAQHRVLAGEDLFASVPRHPELHRLQVEHDLRTKLIRLRTRYIPAAHDRKKLERLMMESVSTFLTLFRHALVALGEPLHHRKEDVLDAAARRFEFSAEPFRRVLAARRDDSRLTQNNEDAESLFAAYLDAIQRVERLVEKA